MADYSAQIKSSYDVIKKKGVAAILKQSGSGEHIHQLGLTAYSEAELTSNISDSDVDIGIKNISTPFYSSGTVWIDHEEIVYSSLESSNILKDCTRGNSSTIAVSHSSGREVYLISQDTQQNTYVVMLDLKSTEIDGAEIKKGDQKLLMSAYGLTTIPAVRNTVTIAGIDYVILPKIKSVAPSDVPIIYTLYVRGSK